MDELHVVPLSRQAVSILREFYPLTGPEGYVFSSPRSRLRPLSNVTLNAALRRLGYSSDEQTPHGFRAIASTLLNEQGWIRVSSSCSWRTPSGTKSAPPTTAPSGSRSVAR
jgi:integrase